MDKLARPATTHGRDVGGNPLILVLISLRGRSTTGSTEAHGRHYDNSKPVTDLLISRSLTSIVLDVFVLAWDSLETLPLHRAVIRRGEMYIQSILPIFCSSSVARLRVLKRSLKEGWERG